MDGSKVTDTITGVILAGGKSRRMGRDKATLPIGSSYMIEYPLKVLKRHFKEIMVITNSRLSVKLKKILGPYVKIFEDVYPGHGALGGIYTALYHSYSPYVFVTACDMPFISDGLISHMSELIGTHDIIVPKGSKGYETLHSIYRKTIRDIVYDRILMNQNKIIEIYPLVNVLEIPVNEIKRFASDERMFKNINTEQELVENFS